MSDHDTTPNPGQGAGERDPVSAIVEEFAYLCAEQRDVDLEAFCDRWPEDLRPEILRRCRDALAVQALLGGRADAASGEDSGELSHAFTAGRLGEFRLIRELGRGGMGVVYLAYQESLRREVALKVLSLGPGLGPRTVERFRREARAAARLMHPGIVHVLSEGEADGSLYIAMEHIDGETLTEHLDVTRRSAIEGWQLGQIRDRGYPARVAGLVAEVADALHHAHQHGVIHRDIKPGNILVDRAGRPHVLDFGLAKDLGEASLSRAGDLAGTPYYMSPEQALAKRIDVDHRTDVYSLGVVLYELLTGARPFEGDSLERILFAISFSNPRPLRRLNPRVPRDLATICETAIEKNPTHRYADAAAMARDLRHFMDYESLEVHPPGPVRKLWRLAVQRRREVASALVAMLVVAVLAGLVSHVRRAGQLDERVREVRLAAAGELAGKHALALRDLQRDVAGLRAEPDLAADVEAELSALDAAIVTEAEARRDVAVAAFHTELEAVQAAARPGAALDLLDRLEDLERAAWLLPDDAELAALLADAAPLPRLTVTVDELHVGAVVSVREIDPFTGALGPARELGTAPLERAALHPGYHRIVVHDPAVGFAEVTRWLALGADEVVHAWIRPTDMLLEGMAAIDGGPFVCGQENGGYEPVARHEAHVEAFRMDRDEVTGAQYLAFLEATGWPPPPAWGSDPDPRLLELPVADLRFEDARAYAEWAGKRLPTVFEWERAARGTDGRRFPWADDDPSRVAERANVETARPRAVTDPQRVHATLLADHLDHVRPAGWAPDEAATPEGIRDLLGNVAEWTESVPIEQIGVGPRAQRKPDDTARVVKGLSWARGKAEVAVLGVTVQSHAPRGVPAPTTGLRCVKSVEP